MISIDCSLHHIKDFSLIFSELTVLLVKDQSLGVVILLYLLFIEYQLLFLLIGLSDSFHHFIMS